VIEKGLNSAHVPTQSPPQVVGNACVQHRFVFIGYDVYVIAMVARYFHLYAEWGIFDGSAAVQM